MTLNIDVAVNTVSDVPNIIVVFHGCFLIPDPLDDAPMSIGDYHSNVDSWRKNTLAAFWKRMLNWLPLRGSHGKL